MPASPRDGTIVTVETWPSWGLRRKEVEQMVARSTDSPPTVSEQAANREEKRRPPLQRLQTNGVMWVAVTLATVAALAYVMIEVGVLAVGPATGPAGIVYTAAGG